MIAITETRTRTDHDHVHDQLHDLAASRLGVSPVPRLRRFMQKLALLLPALSHVSPHIAPCARQLANVTTASQPQRTDVNSPSKFFILYLPSSIVLQHTYLAFILSSFTVFFFFGSVISK